MRPWVFRELVVFADTIEALTAERPPMPAEPTAAVLRPDVVDALFHAEPQLQASFKGFLAQGYVGVALHQGDDWVSYIWSSTPETRSPLHLPASLSGKNWLFTGHTRADSRNRGYLRRTIRELAWHLGNVQGSPTAMLYADVMTTNLVSRRTVTSMGMTPCGTMWTVRIPGTRWVWGGWNPSREHPGGPVAHPDERRCS